MTHFATSNPHKFEEAQALFQKADLELEHFDTELTEIQTDNVEELALFSVREAYEKLQKPVFVEDAGLFIDTLKGFPGVYSKHALLTIGIEGILKLLEKEENRAARFQAVAAYKDAETEKVFKGECIGRIALQASGRGGFGFDPVFIPEGTEKTFAEDVETKTSRSHRTQALTRLMEHLKS